MYWHYGCHRLFACLLTRYMVMQHKYKKTYDCFHQAIQLWWSWIELFRNVEPTGDKCFCISEKEFWIVRCQAVLFEIAFVINMYMSCNIFLGRYFICEIFVGKSHSFCRSLSWALLHSTLSHTHFFLLNLWLQMPIPPWKKR